jgi:D-alanyl-D-alanine carboxypeptidase
MVSCCVSVRRGRLPVLVCLAGLAAALSSPAEARRRPQAGGGYNPPYATMVVDAKTGRTLHAENEDAPRHPASVTKVMTLYLLFEQLERGKISLATPFRISANAASQSPSKLGLAAGETIEVEDAIKALVTKSANDIAVAIAENLAGSEEAFAAEMTRKARALGMSRTVYRNASGLPDPEQITTARDLTILARAVQDRFPRYYRYFQTRAFNYAGESHRNHNKLLGRIDGVDGIKTGFTRASGFNLMTNVKTDDRHIVAVVLGGRSGASRNQAMAALVQANLPRAYAGARQAPLVIEGARTQVADLNVETTATAPARPLSPTADAAPPRRAPAPLDLAMMRPVFASAPGATSTTTPSALPLKVASASLPETAQAYAPPLTETYEAPLPPPNPAAKIQARLQNPEIVVARLEPPKIEKAEPVKVEPARSEAAKAKPDAEARAEAPKVKPAPEATPERLSRSMTGWVIQLGAMDDETKAKEVLEQARTRSGRILSRASAFTEKVVREGTTLYRARFSGFEEGDSAQAACKTLKRSGFNCFATRS